MRCCFVSAVLLCCSLAVGSPAALATEKTSALLAFSVLTAEDLLFFAPPAPLSEADAGKPTAELSTAPDETFYMQHTQAEDGEYSILRQRRFAGVEDAHVTQLVFNKRFFKDTKAAGAAGTQGATGSLQPGTANPDVWLVSMHYPQNVGHPAADAFLEQYVQRRFREILPMEPEGSVAASRQAGVAAPQRFRPANASLSHGNGGEAESLLAQSCAATRRHLSSGGKPPVQPGKAFSFPYHSVTTYVLTRPSEQYLSVVFTRESYWGGAHNTWTSTAFTFDLRTGLLLQPSDIFTGSIAQRAALKERLGELAVRAGVESETALYGPQNNLLQTQRLALTPRGLIFIYNPGEVDSYGDGSVLLTVPVYDLQDYGINTRFWQ